MTQTTTWPDLEDTMLRSQTQKVTYCLIPFIENVQNRQIHRNGKDYLLPRAGERKEEEKSARDDDRQARRQRGWPGALLEFARALKSTPGGLLGRDPS